jgi:hypothetical protein
MQVIAPVIARFDSLKDTIYATWRGMPGLDPRRVESALKYLDDFYRVIDDPKKARREFTYAC